MFWLSIEWQPMNGVKLNCFLMLEIMCPKLVFSDLKSNEMIKKCLEKLKNDPKIYTFCGQVKKLVKRQRFVC